MRRSATRSRARSCAGPFGSATTLALKHGAAPIGRSTWNCCSGRQGNRQPSPSATPVRRFPRFVRFSWPSDFDVYTSASARYCQPCRQTPLRCCVSYRVGRKQGLFDSHIITNNRKQCSSPYARSWMNQRSCLGLPSH